MQRAAGEPEVGVAPLEGPKGGTSMSGSNDPKVAVDIGLSAKASLEAKVSTEIPAQSSGRLLDAITDIFRPYSERRGLKADQIRLQREDVLIEIAQKAQRRLQIENQQPSPLPNKFLVPFLEKASLEELDSVLIDRWADLLASCSIDPQSAHPRFVQVLSELSGRDAQLLKEIAINCINEMEYPHLSYNDGPAEFDPKYVRDDMTKFLINSKSIDDIMKRVDELYDNLLPYFACPGVSLLDIMISSKQDINKYWSLHFNGNNKGVPAALAHREYSLDILYSLYLLRQHEIQISDEALEVEIYYVCLTPLAIEFLKKCDCDLERMVRRVPDDPSN